MIRGLSRLGAAALLSSGGCRSESWVRSDGLLGADVGRIEAARWLDLAVDRDREGGVGLVVLSSAPVGCQDLRSGGLPWAGSHQNFMADGAGVVGLYRWSVRDGPASFEGVYLQGGYVYVESFDEERNFVLLLFEDGISRYAAYEGGTSELRVYSKSSVLGTFETPLAWGEFNAEHCGQLESEGYGYGYSY